MNNKFIVQDTTDEIVVGGFGNLEGNLGLLKYNKEDIRKMITENNNGNDNIRLINSLLQSLKELQERLQEKEDIINKIIKKCNKEKGRTDFDIFINLNEQLKTLENFSKKIDYNLHPIITEAYKCAIRNSIENLCKTLRYDVVYKDSIKEILDNKGE